VGQVLQRTAHHTTASSKALREKSLAFLSDLLQRCLNLQHSLAAEVAGTGLLIPLGVFSGTVSEETGCVSNAAFL
jgi:hypothetical protein